MPATAILERTSRERSPRALVTVLALVILATAGAAWPSASEARDLTPQIVAIRRSQLYYESVMRAADRDVHAYKRAHKQAKRKLKAAKQRLRKAAARRREAAATLAATRSTLRSARSAVVASTTEAPPPPDTATAILVLQAAAAEPSTDDEPALATDPQLGFLAFDPAQPSAGVAATTIRSPSAEVTLKDVVRLEKKFKRQKRQLRSVKRLTARAGRNVRAKGRNVSASRARYRYAIARRESAEAALGGRILAMAKLAQRRAVKQARFKKIRTSGFVWPARGRISQSYGCTGYPLNPARGGCRHFHDGLDIVSYRGAPIRASAMGVVSYIGWNPWDQDGRAFMIVVAHANGLETLYGHVLPTRRVRVGELVRQGHVIGYMGSTGRSTGVHLHFELRRGRSTINPLGHL